MTNDLPARPDGRRRTRVLSDKYLLALDTMVWGGLNHLEAGAKLNIPARQMRRLMGKPAAVAHLREQKAALRSSLGPKILHRLEALAMQDANRAAAVRACLAIEHAPAENESRIGASAPGFVIILNQPAHALPAGDGNSAIVIDAARRAGSPLAADEALVDEIALRVGR